jgi:hypothetical protein
MGSAPKGDDMKDLDTGGTKPAPASSTSPHDQHKR